MRAAGRRHAGAAQSFRLSKPQLSNAAFASRQGVVCKVAGGVASVKWGLEMWGRRRRAGGGVVRLDELLAGFPGLTAHVLRPLSMRNNILLCTSSLRASSLTTLTRPSIRPLRARLPPLQVRVLRLRLRAMEIRVLRIHTWPLHSGLVSSNSF